MSKLSLKQLLQHKLSPQQIQFIKLLQVPVAELETRVKEELELNPALEEGALEERAEEDPEESIDDSVSDALKDPAMQDYLREDFRGAADRKGDQSSREFVTAAPPPSVQDALIDQLGFLKLSDRERLICRQLIGSIEGDGYIRRDLTGIAHDLNLAEGINTSTKEVEEALKKIQSFDPPGIAAHDLKECLLLQLERMPPTHEVTLARQVLTQCTDDFFKKRYTKVASRLKLKSEEELREAVELITRLNPKPGGSESGWGSVQYIIPDFILTHNGSNLEVSLNAKNAPMLRISRSYAEMFKAYETSDDRSDRKLKETALFVKQKLEAARWFIDAINQRQQTLLKTMQAIVDFQGEYFLEGDESKLKPMILKDIAQRVSMDISTISRVVNSKAVQTHFGTFILKRFFSEGIATDSGEEVSNREVKRIIAELIAGEDKRRPMSDERLEKLLRGKGYHVARRTVAKYREQLQIPTARLRRELR